MKFGHRGLTSGTWNYYRTRRLHQPNHGYAVSREDLPEHLIITHEEINDKSVESSPQIPARFLCSIPPRCSPMVPHDASYLFDEFIEMMEAFKQLN